MRRFTPEPTLDCLPRCYALLIRILTGYLSFEIPTSECWGTLQLGRSPSISENPGGFRI